MARYAIGDVQGCMTSLERLLAAIAFDASRDELWLVGDLVNRGPRSLDVLRWARGLGDRVTCVLGNHDLHLLARVAGAAGQKKRDTLDAVLAAPDRDELCDWLRERPLLHVDGELAMVHAGLHPRWTIAEARALAGELEAALRGPSWRDFLGELQAKTPVWSSSLDGAARRRATTAYFTRARTLHRDGTMEPEFNRAPGDAPAGCAPWFAFADAAWTTHTVVCGHWAALGLAIGARHLALDTGCVWGKQLTAIRLDDRAVFQVDAAD